MKNKKGGFNLEFTICLLCVGGMSIFLIMLFVIDGIPMFLFFLDRPFIFILPLIPFVFSFFGLLIDYYINIKNKRTKN